MSAVGSVGSGTSVQQIVRQAQTQGGAKKTSKPAEEQAESASQEAAEHEGGGLDVTA